MIDLRRPDIDFIDEVLGDYRGFIGDAFAGYRNHVVRMAHFCLALHDCSADEQRRIEVAAVFHDIGIWTANTLDYLPPSVPPAQDWLEGHDLAAWKQEVSEMILAHHKLRPVRDGISPLVEVFRRGDLIDFSLGMVRFGLPRPYVRAVQAEFPNAGFHRMLLRLAGSWVVRHPLNPAPMMKW